MAAGAQFEKTSGARVRTFFGASDECGSGLVWLSVIDVDLWVHCYKYLEFFDNINSNDEVFNLHKLIILSRPESLFLVLR